MALRSFTRADTVSSLLLPSTPSKIQLRSGEGRLRDGAKLCTCSNTRRLDVKGEIPGGEFCVRTVISGFEGKLKNFEIVFESVGTLARRTIMGFFRLFRGLSAYKTNLGFEFICITTFRFYFNRKIYSITYIYILCTMFI